MSAVTALTVPTRALAVLVLALGVLVVPAASVRASCSFDVDAFEAAR